MTRPVDDEDLGLLIGLLAVCEGVVWGEHDGGMPLGDALRQRWSTGPLSPDGDAYAVRQLLNDLNHRLRYARGEYEQPPASVPLPE